MKFLGLRIFIGILEVAAFLLIAPCLILVGWAIFGDSHPLSGQSLAQGAIAVAAVGGVVLVGAVVAAFASALRVLLAIERNTADALREQIANRNTALPDTEGRPLAKDEGTPHRFLE